MNRRLLSIRFFLPLKDNTGKAFSVSTLKRTYQDILKKFGAYSLFEQAKGVWTHGGVTYIDEVNIVEVITYDSPMIREWVKAYKQVLKRRFRQLEVFVTVQRVEVL